MLNTKVQVRKQLHSTPKVVTNSALYSAALWQSSKRGKEQNGILNEKLAQKSKQQSPPNPAQRYRRRNGR